MLNCWQFDSRDRNQFKIILEQLEVICSKILLQKEGTFFKIFYMHYSTYKIRFNVVKIKCSQKLKFENRIENNAHTKTSTRA